jgi:hypothetical protein
LAVQSTKAQDAVTDTGSYWDANGFTRCTNPLASTHFRGAHPVEVLLQLRADREPSLQIPPGIVYY